MSKVARWARILDGAWLVSVLFVMVFFSAPLYAQASANAKTLVAPSPASPSAPKGRIARAMFTTDIVAREPINRVLVLSDAVHKIYFFTDLRNFEGKTVVHHWYHDGKEVATVGFKVKGRRWRVYSSKTLYPDDLGRWMVIVTDDHGWPIKASIFQYVAGGKGKNERPVILPPDAAQ